MGTDVELLALDEKIKNLQKIEEEKDKYNNQVIKEKKRHLMEMKQFFDGVLKRISDTGIRCIRASFGKYEVIASHQKEEFRVTIKGISEEDYSEYPIYANLLPIDQMEEESSDLLFLYYPDIKEAILQEFEKLVDEEYNKCKVRISSQKKMLETIDRL